MNYQFEQTVSPARYAERTRAGLETPTKDAHKVIRDKIVNGACPAEDFSIFRSYENSLVLLKKYATLDWQHCMDIFRVEDAIRAYAIDTKRKKPLNIVMHASPGTGKSHFVECLADALKGEGVGSIAVNMTSIGGLDDLSGSLDELRNLKVKGKLPILFLDEFDSSPQNYALLLPLLWDGKVAIGGRTIELGKFVAILAGSKPEIGRELDNSRDMKRDAGKVSVEGQSSKLPDLVSRINGPEITIPDLDLVDQKADRCRKVDKVCLTVALLKERFGPGLRKVPWALLKFVSDTKFQYGVRSITNLVDSIEKVNLKDGALALIDLKFPFGAEKRLQESHLPIHIHEENGVQGIVERWKNLCQCDKLVEFELDPGTMRKYSQDFFDYWLLKKPKGK